MMKTKMASVPRKDDPRAESRRRFLRAMFSRKIVVVATAIVVLFILAAGLAPALSPYDPMLQIFMTLARRQPLSIFLAPMLPAEMF